jgi:hypothetical protein
MHHIKLTRSVTLPAGTILKLAPEQVSVRSHLLDDLGDETFATLAQTQFKAGENIGLDNIDVLPKDLAAELVDRPAPVPSEPASPPPVASPGKRAGKATAKAEA